MRKTYLYVMVGGAVGAALRFGIGQKEIHIIADNFPSGTFIVNILGTFILAFFLRWAFDSEVFSRDIHAGIAPGLLGAFTTFSTLCKESSQLLLQGEIFLVIVYLILSVAVGLSFAWLGFTLSGWRQK